MLLFTAFLAMALPGPQQTSLSAPEIPDGRLGGAEPRNALVILLDDWGMDMVEIYGVPDLSGACITRPPTPNIDALAQTGVTFLNAWVEPVCSPTRASNTSWTDSITRSTSR